MIRHKTSSQTIKQLEKIFNNFFFISKENLLFIAKLIEFINMHLSYCCKHFVFNAPFLFAEIEKQ